MNLQQLNSPLPKSWLNINCNELNANTMNVVNNLDVQDIDAITTQTQSLLLDQNVVASIPMVGYSLIYADNTDRLNVASQSQPTQQIAYLSDVMLLTNEIISNDLSCNVKCSNGGIVESNINGNQRLLMNDTGYTSLRTNSVDTRIDIDNNGSIYWASNGLPVLYVLGSSSRIWSPDNSILLTLENGSGVRINNSYYLPTSDGTLDQILSTNGAGVTSWVSPKIYGLYSATGVPVTVVSTNLQTNIIPSGVGSLDIPANITPGSSFILKAGGVFRDNVNNTQFTFRLLNNLNTLFSTGLLTLNSVPVSTPFNIDIQFTYMGGSQMITNFKFSYNSGSSALGFVSQQVNNSYNATIINTIGLTLQFVVSSINNTLTCNYLTLNKTF
jgi:hypothetical protein